MKQRATSVAMPSFDPQANCECIYKKDWQVVKVQVLQYSKVHQSSVIKVLGRNDIKSRLFVIVTK